MRYPTNSLQLPHELRFLQVMAPPITGKSTLLPLAKNLLFHQLFENKKCLILVENEVHGIGVRTRAAGKSFAEKASISYDSPEFAKGFNLPGVLDYQDGALWQATDAMITWDMPVTVILPTPERDMSDEFKQMVEKQFEAMGASISFCTFYLDGSEEELEPVLKERKILRANQSPSPDEQRAIDATKTAADYIARRQKCIESANRFQLNSAQLAPTGSIEEHAAQLADLLSYSI